MTLVAGHLYRIFQSYRLLVYVARPANVWLAMRPVALDACRMFPGHAPGMARLVMADLRCQHGRGCRGRRWLMATVAVDTGLPV